MEVDRSNDTLYTILFDGLGIQERRSCFVIMTENIRDLMMDKR